MKHFCSYIRTFEIPYFTEKNYISSISFHHNVNEVITNNLSFYLMVVFVFRGPPRRPPPQVQEQVKSLNQSLRLGHLLCRSRNPDFLLNIIQRQVMTISITLPNSASPHLHKITSFFPLFSFLL